VQFPSALPAQRTVRHTTMTRCDERRALELNNEARLYGWSPLNFVSRDIYRVRSWWRERLEPQAAGPDVKINIHSVDTANAARWVRIRPDTSSQPSRRIAVLARIRGPVNPSRMVGTSISRLLGAGVPVIATFSGPVPSCALVGRPSA